MFKYDLSYINLIHLSKVSINEKKLTVRYFWDGRIESQTFADQSEFDAAVDSITSAGLLLIGKTYYNKDRLSIVIPNGKNCSFLFNGNVIIKHLYEDVSDVDAVIAEIEPEFIEINSKWYQGKQIHVAKTNDITLTISYDYLGMDWFDVTYEDQAAYDAAIEKLANLGNGGAPTPPTPKTAKPTFSPSAGSVPVGTSVTISCADAGATIYYTTNGTTPDETSSVYSSAIAIPNEGITIKAVAKAADKDLSTVASAHYTVSMETVATPTFSPSAGAVNIGTEVSISCATGGAEIHYTTDGTTPSASSPVYSSAITIDAAQTIKAIAIKTGMTNSSVASASYTIAKVATPNFSVPAGEVESGTTVTITCSTSGATIHYTTDGTDPTSSSPTYSAPIEITTAITLKAIAVKANMDDSSIKSASYTVAVVLTRYAGWVVNSKPVGGITFDKALLEGMEDLQTDTVADKASPSGFKYTGTAGTSVGNSRPTWAYPAQYGECTEVWNGLSWSPATEDYTLKQVDIDGVPYNIYIMTTKMVGDVGQEYPWPFR